MSISGAQLTKLGERLRAGPLSEADLRLLDEYRRSFGPASEQVLAILRETIDVPVTVRGAKSTQAIVEKLRRQSCRLGQIQDIAGCRLVVATMQDQDEVTGMILERFPEAQVFDRRDAPSHGYRALHLVVRAQERWVEIQVRTELQHQWASMSEMLADICGMEVKYGGGPAQVQEVLSNASFAIADVEALGVELRRLVLMMPSLPARPTFFQEPFEALTKDQQALLEDYRLAENLQAAIQAEVDRLGEEALLRHQALKQHISTLIEQLLPFRHP